MNNFLAFFSQLLDRGTSALSVDCLSCAVPVEKVTPCTIGDQSDNVHEVSGSSDGGLQPVSQFDYDAVAKLYAGRRKGRMLSQFSDMSARSQ